jgi:hypothetical protein
MRFFALSGAHVTPWSLKYRLEVQVLPNSLFIFVRASQLYKFSPHISGSAQICTIYSHFVVTPMCYGESSEGIYSSGCPRMMHVIGRPDSAGGRRVTDGRNITQLMTVGKSTGRTKVLNAIFRSMIYLKCHNSRRMPYKHRQLLYSVILLAPCCSYLARTSKSPSLPPSYPHNLKFSYIQSSEGSLTRP